MSKKYLETIKSLDGVLYHLEYHQRRLNSNLDKAVHNLSFLLHPPSDGLYRCRVVYDEVSVKIEYLKYSKRHIRKLKLIYSDTIVYTKKYENRDDINVLYAQKESCDDILIVKNGFICDTSIANIAFFDGVDWVTPSEPLLHGTTRARLLDTKKIVQKDIRVEDLKSFTKVALMNAMVDFDIITKENIEEIIC